MISEYFTKEYMLSKKIIREAVITSEAAVIIREYWLSSFKSFQRVGGWFVGRELSTNYIPQIPETVLCTDRKFEYEKDLTQIPQLSIFFFFFRERKRAEWAGEGWWENLKQTPNSVWSLMLGSISWPWDHDLSWNQDQKVNWLSHPSAPAAQSPCEPSCSAWDTHACVQISGLGP